VHVRCIKKLNEGETFMQEAIEILKGDESKDAPREAYEALDIFTDIDKETKRLQEQILSEPTL
jgi:hypothetical protein